MCGLVAAHNEARAAVSTSTPLPTMSWDTAAAAAAQTWANNCTWSHNAGSYGQNMYASAGIGAPTPAEVVADWVAEVQYYTYSTNACTAPTGKSCGHYTQVVWRTSILVGCGMTYCTTGSPWGTAYPNWWNFVCDYSPPGNYVGQKPY
jgi:uncharacterized protein YkwD